MIEKIFDFIINVSVCKLLLIGIFLLIVLFMLCKLISNIIKYLCNIEYTKTVKDYFKIICKELYFKKESPAIYHLDAFFLILIAFLTIILFIISLLPSSIKNIFWGDTSMMSLPLIIAIVGIIAIIIMAIISARFVIKMEWKDKIQKDHK